GGGGPVCLVPHGARVRSARAAVRGFPGREYRAGAVAARAGARAGASAGARCRGKRTPARPRIACRRTRYTSGAPSRGSESSTMYRAPVREMRFVLEELLGAGSLGASGLLADYSDELARAVLEEAGRFAETVLEPL